MVKEIFHYANIIEENEDDEFNEEDLNNLGNIEVDGKWFFNLLIKLSDIIRIMPKELIEILISNKNDD